MPRDPSAFDAGVREKGFTGLDWQCWPTVMSQGNFERFVLQVMSRPVQLVMQRSQPGLLFLFRLDLFLAALKTPRKRCFAVLLLGDFGAEDPLQHRRPSGADLRVDSRIPPEVYRS